MALIGYARISTKNQKLDMQLDALKEYGCTKIYHETVSSSKQKRFEFEKCMDYLREGDTLVCYSFCRIARTHKELIAVKEELDSKNIPLVAIKGNIDTSSNHGKLYFQIYASILEFERSWTSDRVIQGLKSARARGRRGGRKYLLTNRQVDVLMDMYNSRKYTISEIGTHFKIKKPTVWKYIQRQREKGNENESESDFKC